MQEKAFKRALLLKYVKNAAPIIFFLVKSRSFAKQSYMKKFSLIATLLATVLLLQNCKKDTQTAIATSTRPLIATINDTTWDPTNITSSITYNSATKTKVFTFTGADTNRRITAYVTQSLTTNTPGFPLNTYRVDQTANNAFSYYFGIKDGSGTVVFTQQGVVGPGSGTLTVTAIDSVKKVITGSFSFTSLRNNYNTDGTIKSVTVSQVSSGGFNSLPYTFISN